MSVISLPAYRTVSDLHYGKALDDQQLERSAQYLERAAARAPGEQLFTDLGRIQYLRAMQKDVDDPATESLLSASREMLRRALMLGPARPHGWVWFAYTRAMEGAPPEEVVALIRRSVELGPFVSEIFSPRLALLLQVWPHLPADLRGYAGKQIRYGWLNEPDLVIRIARTTPRPDVIRFALQPLPGAIARLDKALPPPNS